MGVYGAYVVLDPDKKKNLIAKYNQQQSAMSGVEQGSQGYGGTIAQLNRHPKFLKFIADSENDAIDYIEDHAKAREDSLAICYFRKSRAKVESEKTADANIYFQQGLVDIKDMEAAIDGDTGEWADEVYDFDTFEEPEMFVIPAPFGRNGKEEKHILEGAMLTGSISDFQKSINALAEKAKKY